METMVSKSKFKAKALEYLRTVERTGRDLIVTDRGRPVVRVVAYREETGDALRSLRGTVLAYDRPTDPVGEDEWEALR
ncbi:MAG: type II toxin-antitoxin system prevent-host-death family antitoxin [Planctomycetota bacterium]